LAQKPFETKNIQLISELMPTSEWVKQDEEYIEQDGDKAEYAACGGNPHSQIANGYSAVHGLPQHLKVCVFLATMSQHQVFVVRFYAEHPPMGDANHLEGLVMKLLLVMVLLLVGVVAAYAGCPAGTDYSCAPMPSGKVFCNCR
jgi:hypothetical protein